MRKIGDIQLFAEIKRTAFGATYRGMDAVRQQLVLVKTFRRMADDHASSLAESRFEREAAIYASIKHPNVVRLLEYGMTDEMKFLVLEFIEGQSLRNLLKNTVLGETLPAEIAAAIFWSIMAGIEELHRRNVIHRDLKPENILIAHDGAVKICDFDLAISGETQQTSGLTGSPGYLSPEIILGQEITATVDIFSSGVLLYEMLTGMRPFKAGTVSGEMNAVVQVAHLPPSKVNPNIPSQIDPLLDKLLAKKTADRFNSANEVLKWLARHFDLKAEKKRSQLLQKYLTDPEKYQPLKWQSDFAQSEDVTFKSTKKRFRFAPAILGTALFVFLVFAWQLSKQVTGPDMALQEAPDRIAKENVDQVNPSERDSVKVLRENESAEPVKDRSNQDVALQAANQIDSASLKMATPQPENKPVLRQVFIQTNPWAYVFVNRDSLGPTPLHKPIALFEGEYGLTLKNPNFPLLQFALAVDSRTPDTLTYSLWQHIAQLEIKITPWADLYINGKQHELPAGENTMFLLPGKYDLRFVHPRLGEKTETIFLQAGERRQIAVNMFSL